MRHSFGDALNVLKAGGRVARSGWNGKGMWLVLVTPIALPHLDYKALNPSGFYGFINPPTEGENAVGPHPTLPFIAMKTATNEFVPWLASQTDVLAEDWEIATLNKGENNAA